MKAGVELEPIKRILSFFSKKFVFKINVYYDKRNTKIPVAARKSENGIGLINLIIFLNRKIIL